MSGKTNRLVFLPESPEGSSLHLKYMAHSVGHVMLSSNVSCVFPLFPERTVTIRNELWSSTPLPLQLLESR